MVLTLTLKFSTIKLVSRIFFIKQTNLKIIIFSKKFFFFSRGFLNQVVGDVVQDGVVGDDPHVHGGLGVIDVPVFLGLLPQVPLLIQIGNDFG